VVILFARHKRPGRAWDKRRPAENVYLDQETGRKRAACRFNPAFSVWLALGHIQRVTSRETAPQELARASKTPPCIEKSRLPEFSKHLYPS
jgi:hypothetical protein